MTAHSAISSIRKDNLSPFLSIDYYGKHNEAIQCQFKFVALNVTICHTTD